MCDCTSADWHPPRSNSEANSCFPRFPALLHRDYGTACCGILDQLQSCGGRRSQIFRSWTASSADLACHSRAYGGGPDRRRRLGTNATHIFLIIFVGSKILSKALPRGPESTHGAKRSPSHPERSPGRPRIDKQIKHGSKRQARKRSIYAGPKYKPGPGGASPARRPDNRSQA